MTEIDMQRRKYLLSLAAAGGIGTLAGCIGSDSGEGASEQQAEPEKPDEIRFGTYGGSYYEAQKQAFVGPFEDQTGIKVTRQEGYGSDRLAKLIAQGENPPIDVTHLGEQGMIQGESEDLWEPLSDIVPLYDQIPSKFKGNGWCANIFSPQPILYNPDAFDEPPTSFEVFLNEEYKGRVGIRKPSGDPINNLMNFSLYKTNGKTLKNMEAALEMWEEVNKNMDPVFMGTSDDQEKKWAEGSIDVASYWTARAITWNKKGISVRSSLADEGAYCGMFGNAIPKNLPSERKEYAAKLINLSLSQQGANGMVRALNYANPNPNVTYPDEIKDDIVKADQVDDMNFVDEEFVSRDLGKIRERAVEITNKYA